MAVAAHLHIRLDEYDDRIRTFIPGYEAMLDSVAHAIGTLPHEAPHIVDLGTGTGALAGRCLARRPRARLTAIDEDDEILALARGRLSPLTSESTFVRGSFTEVPLPACDAIVASLSLHHIRTREAKLALYQRCRAALVSGGLLVSADCCPAGDARLAAAQFEAWRAHLRQTYSAEESDAYLAAWAEEDVYVPLSDEMALMVTAGFAVDLVWRGGAMAVIAARAI